MPVNDLILINLQFCFQITIQQNLLRMQVQNQTNHQPIIISAAQLQNHQPQILQMTQSQPTANVFLNHNTSNDE